MGRNKQPVKKEANIFELIQRWYEKDGGRETSRRCAELGRESARAVDASLRVPAHALDEPVNY